MGGRGRLPVEVERLRLLVLHCLNEEPMHGYRIMKNIGRLFGVRAPSPGSLYPLLRTLKEEGLIETLFESEGRGRNAPKVYRITGKGRKYLESHREELKEVLLKASAIRRFAETGGLELLNCMGVLMNNLSRLDEERRKILADAIRESVKIIKDALMKCGLRCE